MKHFAIVGLAAWMLTSSAAALAGPNWEIIHIERQDLSHPHDSCPSK